MLRSWLLSLALFPMLSACGDTHERSDAGEERVVCVASGAHLTEDGCLTRVRAFAEKRVAADECLNTTETRCLQAIPDSGLVGAWLFSGDYYLGISRTQACTAETFSRAQSAPACPAGTECPPCDRDAGGLCTLAPPCE